MKAKLAAVVAAKIRLWAALCQPFTGEHPPSDAKASEACMHAQVELTQALHDYEGIMEVSRTQIGGHP